MHGVYFVQIGLHGRFYSKPLDTFVGFVKQGQESIQSSLFPLAFSDLMSKFYSKCTFFQKFYCWMCCNLV